MPELQKKYYPVKKCLHLTDVHITAVCLLLPLKYIIISGSLLCMYWPFKNNLYIKRIIIVHLTQTTSYGLHAMGVTYLLTILLG